MRWLIEPIDPSAGGWRKKWRASYEWAVLVRNPDSDAQRRGHLLAGILLGCLLFLLVVTLLNFIQIFTDPGQGYVVFSIEDVATIAGLVILIWLNRSGRVQLAAGIFLVLTTLVITFFDPLVTLDRILLAYAIPIAAASFLIGPGYSFLFGVLAAAGYSGIYLTGHATMPYNYLSVVILFVFALVSTLIASEMANLLREACLALKTNQDAQNALRLSEDKFKQVFENSVSGKSITKVSGEMEVNQAFCDMLGYSRQELNNTRWQEITHPEDVQLTQVTIDSLMSGEKETARFTKRYLHKNGSIVWADVGTALRRDRDGQPLYLVTSINDITERKLTEEKLRESETRYQLIFEHSGTANTIFDMDCRVVLQNSQSQKLTMPADALGKTALEVFGSEQGPIVDERMRRILASGVPEAFETKFNMPVGEKWIRSSYQPLFNGHHVVVGIQVISQDITMQKQAEETLRDYNTRLASEVAARTQELTEAQEKLVRQDKLAVLGQMAGSVGHELRNPLAVINNSVYYLKMVQPEADEKIRKYHVIIEQEVHNAEKIISDLLDFARVKSVEREQVAIPALVQRVLERFPVPSFIKTELDLQPGLPDVFIDLRQMEQVLGNLTTNACQAMKEAGQLIISSEELSVNGEKWVLVRVQGYRHRHHSG